MSDDSSELSSVPSEDESDLQLKKKGGILKFFSKVNPKTEKPKKANSSPPPPEREPSPPHEYVLADNPDIAVCFPTIVRGLRVDIHVMSRRVLSVDLANYIIPVHRHVPIAVHGSLPQISRQLRASRA